jgi:hypothetical protein
VQFSARSIKSLAKTKYAIVEPGDILYFPNYASHMVYTMEGPNLMATMNYMNLQKAFNINTFVTLQMVLSFIASKGVDMAGSFLQGKFHIEHGQHNTHSPHAQTINLWGSNLETQRDELLHSYLRCIGSAKDTLARAECSKIQ